MIAGAPGGGGAPPPPPPTRRGGEHNIFPCRPLGDWAGYPGALGAVVA